MADQKAYIAQFYRLAESEMKSSGAGMPAPKPSHDDHTFPKIHKNMKMKAGDARKDIHAPSIQPREKFMRFIPVIEDIDEGLVGNGIKFLGKLGASIGKNNPVSTAMKDIPSNIKRGLAMRGAVAAGSAIAGDAIVHKLGNKRKPRRTHPGMKVENASGTATSSGNIPSSTSRNMRKRKNKSIFVENDIN